MAGKLAAAASAGLQFWRVAGLLLAASYRRAAGRRKRQRQLFAQSGGTPATHFRWFGFAALVLLMVMLHAGAAYLLHSAVVAGERAQAERQGSMVVDNWFVARVTRQNREFNAQSTPWTGGGKAMDRAYDREASGIVREHGGDTGRVAARLRVAVELAGTSRLIDANSVTWGLKTLSPAAPMAGLLGSLVLLAWGLMLVFQGEGLELDLQRRRHPMWEWLFSHPVPQGAVFLAEMLAPIAANPIYFSAPLFPGLVYMLIYGKALGALAVVLIGLPVTVAAASLGKALEIAVVLRFVPRVRGAVVGLMGWAGYASMIGCAALASKAGVVFATLAHVLAPLTALPWPFLGLFVGLRATGFSFAQGLLNCWAFCAMVIAGSVAFGVWGARQGLDSNPGRDAAGPRSRPGRAGGFGRNALYRKELLWFARDRSALVQAILIPLSLAGFQLFNLRFALAMARYDWSLLCGLAVLFGTYFLLVLGPKSLASEGSALWIAMTWPQGLERLLKAKAWLWALLASAIVAPVLVYAAVVFPANAWKVALVGAAWFLFARSMAAKTVTLTTITSDSGELQKVPAGRRLAAQLGILTFAVGIFTQQWNVAVAGVAYSIMTAAAMWQNFRARLPYLYDPWSERLPRAPTLMHAMVGISLLIESAAAASAGLSIFIGHRDAALARAAIYGLCAASVSIGMVVFLSLRDVQPPEIARWRQRPDTALSGPGWHRLAASLALGVTAGLLLGAAGLGYTWVLDQFPQLTVLLQSSRVQLATIPHLRLSLQIMGIVIAPLAEEFLFRGLLYRALDREWGGWRAILGSAAFFAMYHPPLAWLPVGLLGVVNALLFKKTGRLAPAVLTHMIYNAIILM